MTDGNQRREYDPTQFAKMVSASRAFLRAIEQSPTNAVNYTLRRNLYENLQSAAKTAYVEAYKLGFDTSQLSRFRTKLDNKESVTDADLDLMRRFCHDIEAAREIHLTKSPKDHLNLAALIKELTEKGDHWFKWNRLAIESRKLVEAAAKKNDSVHDATESCLADQRERNGVTNEIEKLIEKVSPLMASIGFETTQLWSFFDAISCEADSSRPLPIWRELKPALLSLSDSIISDPNGEKLLTSDSPYSAGPHISSIRGDVAEGVRQGLQAELGNLAALSRSLQSSTDDNSEVNESSLGTNASVGDKEYKQSSSAKASKPTPRSERAHNLYVRVCEARGVENMPDDEAYDDLLVLFEKEDCRLPIPNRAAFKRYLREYRNALGIQKNKPRGGRGGRSVVSKSSI